MRSVSQGSGKLQSVNVVVTCTKRKRLPPAYGLVMRSVDACDVDSAFAEWSSRLEQCTSEPLPARRLYAGDHWSVVQDLEDVSTASQLDPAIWVCSAGYGLIGIDTPIKPYSATFSSSHSDTVCRWSRQSIVGPKDGSSWWECQQSWSGPDPFMPRSIADIAAKDPRSPILVIASKTYMRAISGDVQRAVELLTDPDLLSIISTGTKVLPHLQSNLIPSNSSLQRTVGGSLLSLNIRLARTLLSAIRPEELRASVLGAKVSQLVLETKPFPRNSRERVADEEVKEYIENSLKEDPDVSWSSLLRRLRSEGKACRQERFSDLFKSFRTELVADQKD